MIRLAKIGVGLFAVSASAAFAAAPSAVTLAVSSACCALGACCGMGCC